MTLNEIKEQVKRNNLFLSRVPPKTKEEFILLSNSEFEGDYGMCLKWLLDFRNGLLSDPNERFSEQIIVIIEQLKNLKEELFLVKSKSVEKKKVRRAVNGRIIGGKEYE